MRIALIVLGLAFILFSCEEEENVPDYLLEEAKFIEVLTDLQKAESIVRLGYNRYSDSIYLNDSVYSALFRSQKISRADFDSSMNYYLDRPEQLENIYKQVIESLSKESAELKAKRKELPVEPALKDSED